MPEDAQLHIADALVHLEARATRIGRVVLKVVPHKRHIWALVVVAASASLCPTYYLSKQSSYEWTLEDMCAVQHSHPAASHACLPATLQCASSRVTCMPTCRNADATPYGQQITRNW